MAKVVKPFSAAISAFRANAPDFSSQTGLVSSWLTKHYNRQIAKIDDQTSFSLKEMKDFEKTKIMERPEKLTYENALSTVLTNQEISVHKSHKLFHRSHVPGVPMFLSFASFELFLVISIHEIEAFTYTAMPVFLGMYSLQYVFRYSSVHEEGKKLKMVQSLKKLSDEKQKD